MSSEIGQKFIITRLKACKKLDKKSQKMGEKGVKNGENWAKIRKILKQKIVTKFPLLIKCHVRKFRTTRRVGTVFVKTIIS